MIRVHYLFQNTLDLGCPQAKLVQALQEWSDKHFGPAWGRECVLCGTVDHPGVADCTLIFADDSDQAGALGYHDDPAGSPRGFVFVRDAQRSGRHVATVASHELGELLADPWCNLLVPTPRGRLVALEVCDPVQASTFDVQGLPMSNFVLPSWFGEGPAPYDYLRTLASPFQIGHGGYAIVLDPATWSYSNIFGAGEVALRQDSKARRLRRK